MSLIKNLVKETEEKPRKKKNGKDCEQNEDEEETLRPIIKSATDLQRLKLEKLMKNPDKLVNIPEPRTEKDYMQTVPSFVRNVMGSSAGAGSGEFHVYRHLRRKEYARQKTIQAKSFREKLDDDFQHKLETNRRIAEEKTAKKRAKRLKKKHAKRPRQQQQRVDDRTEGAQTSEEEDDDDDDKDNAAVVDDDGKNEENVVAGEQATTADVEDKQLCAVDDENPNGESPVLIGPKTKNDIESIAIDATAHNKTEDEQANEIQINQTEVQETTKIETKPSENKTDEAIETAAGTKNE